MFHVKLTAAYLPMQNWRRAGPAPPRHRPARSSGPARGVPAAGPPAASSDWPAAGAPACPAQSASMGGLGRREPVALAGDQRVSPPRVDRGRPDGRGRGAHQAPAPVFRRDGQGRPELGAPWRGRPWCRPQIARTGVGSPSCLGAARIRGARAIARDRPARYAPRARNAVNLDRIVLSRSPAVSTNVTGNHRDRSVPR